MQLGPPQKTGSGLEDKGEALLSLLRPSPPWSRLGEVFMCWCGRLEGRESR
ncbi:hypothetical protein Pcinc_038794, partial [Petrolisthes cinctipes]